MPKLILQPCGRGAAADHYAHTVEMQVSLTRLKPFLTGTQFEELGSMSPDGKVATWGVTPGDSSVNRTKWERIEAGDIALFASEGRIFSAGTVITKLRNARLARELWGEDEQGRIWEFMYFLRDIRQLDISYKAFNAAADYKSNNVIQAFSVLPEDKSASIISALSIQMDGAADLRLDIARRELLEAGEFDPHSAAEGRKRILASICRRQGRPEFREKLFVAYSGRCAITGTNVKETLEAAHILPYDGPKTNHVANGLLLRADLHVLFDLGLIGVDPSEFKVVLSPQLRKTYYAEFEGRRISVPSEANLQPNRIALRKQIEDSGLSTR
jgi:hypothetical protein